MATDSLDEWSVRMAADYTWTVVLIAVVCGGPFVAAVLFSVSGTRPWRHVCFAGAAAVAGLWPPWAYILWHGRYYGWRAAEFLEFTEAVLVLSIASPALHGAFGWWLASRLAAESSRRTGEPWRHPSTGRVKPWFVVHAAALGTVCGAALGLWLGWLVSDVASYFGGFLAMLSPEKIMHGVTRRCAPLFGEESVVNPLPPGRFFLLLGFTVVSSSVGRFLLLRKVSNDELARKA